jgi:hypothetical protein
VLSRPRPRDFNGADGRRPGRPRTGGPGLRLRVRRWRSTPARPCPRTGRSTARASLRCSAASRHVYSHLDDGRILRDERWLLEIDKTTHAERFFDCGASLDGTGYRDVTGSSDPEVRAARARFAPVLTSIPGPAPRAGAKPPRAKAARQEQRRAKADP